MTNNINEWKLRGKDTDPVSTVEKIMSILAKAGIETDYAEFPQTIDTCFSSRVTVKGPLSQYIGSNGKGLSADLCKASAYAEFIERLQNTIFATSPLKCDPKLPSINSHLGTYNLTDSETPKCIEFLKKQLLNTTPSSLPLFMRSKNIDDLIKSLSHDENSGIFPTKKFYSLNQKQIVELPIEIILSFTLSNGMAAGNTLEEALVQGCSELFERYSENTLLEGKITPPDIPRNVINSIPSVSHIIDAIEANGKYKVIVKDCSLGKGIPVVCGIICNTNLQSFGVKFGAHPDMTIALERVFSESLQGINLEMFTTGGVPLFVQTQSSRTNNWNLIKTGKGSFPATLINNKPDYEFVPWKDVRKLNNKIIMKKMFNLLSSISEDIYIADVSYLGFPSVMIYAQGISESRPVDLTTLKELKLQNDVIRLFHSKNMFNEEDLKKIVLLCRVKRNAVLENSLSSLTGIMTSQSIPGSPYDALFLEAIASFCLGNVSEAISALLPILEAYKNSVDGDSQYIRVLYLFLTALNAGISLEEAKETILKLSTESIVMLVYDQLLDPSKTISKIYPLCPSFNCNECTVKGNCLYTHVFNFYKKLGELEAANPIDYSEIRGLF